MFDLKSRASKGVLAAAVTLAMMLAGIGGLGATAEASHKHKSARASQKASSKASQKNSIKQGNKQANKNSTKQVGGDGGEGGDGGRTTCVAAANGNAVALGGLIGAAIPVDSGNQSCGNEAENGDGHGCPTECGPYGTSSYGNPHDDGDDDGNDGGDGGDGGDNKNFTFQGNKADNSADYSQDGNSATSVAANASESD